MPGGRFREYYYWASWAVGSKSRLRRPPLPPICRRQVSERLRPFQDSYWVIKGLLASGNLCSYSSGRHRELWLVGMLTTARSMLSNFAYLIDTHGFIPNGGEIFLCNIDGTSLIIFRENLLQFSLAAAALHGDGLRVFR